MSGVTSPTQAELTRRGAIFAATATMDSLIGTGIFERKRANDPLFRAAMVMALVNMKDLLKIADRDGKRVAFTDDVTVTFGKPADVTTLICDARDAACHSGSLNRYVGTNHISAMVLAGKCGGMAFSDGTSLSCDYDDDHCIIYGQIRVYVRRHLLRAYAEVKRALKV